MKKTIFGVLALVVIFFALVAWQKQNRTRESLIGGQADDHGCLIAAGYSWSAEKQKCIRPWEQSPESVRTEITNVLANKYDKPADQVHVTVNSSDDTHAAGSVMFGAGGPGEAGAFLAVKVNGLWKVVFDGNGNVNCELMRMQYGFTDQILKPNFCD